MAGRTFWKLGELPKLLGVRPLPVCRQVDSQQELSGVSTDSRSLQPGELFVALVGDRFDAHDFIPEVVAGGASAVVVAAGRPELLSLAQRFPGVMFLPVDDTLQALGRLARARLERIRPQVFAVTGSNGKTTTRRMLAGILESRFRVHQTAGNFNNRIGLPLTIFAMPDDCEVAVLEIGMNEPGELGELAAIARPDCLLLTNVAKAHLEGLGTLEAVARAKCEAIGGVREAGLVVYNIDDPSFRELVPAVAAGRKAALQLLPVTAFGAADGAGSEPARADEIWLLPEGLSFVFHFAGCRTTFKLPCWGRHNVMNAALAAAAACSRSGIVPAAAAAALADFQPPPGRLQLYRLAGGGLLVHDAYNANPASMAAALTEVAGRRAGRFLGLVLGDMNELGPESGPLHREIGRRVAEIRPDLLVLVGRQVKELAHGALDFGLPANRVFNFPAGAHEKVCRLLQQRLPENFLLLLKGSRTLQLEKIIDPLLSCFAAA
jgi:UDP-N-acetylmuramoyl-tripeptide--D-alanyl-D-alanine ligase